jgi:hypothetical protein
VACVPRSLLVHMPVGSRCPSGALGRGGGCARTDRIPVFPPVLRRALPCALPGNA